MYQEHPPLWYIEEANFFWGKETLAVPTSAIPHHLSSGPQLCVLLNCYSSIEFSFDSGQVRFSQATPGHGLEVHVSEELPVGSQHAATLL